MLLFELLLGLAAFVLAVVVVVAIAATLAAILHDERPEAFLSDPATRRSLLGG